MKDIKDYLHLYLGCDVEVEFPKGRFICKFIGFFNHEYEVITVLRDGGISRHQIEEVKLLLRPLSSMTDEEKVELIRIEHPEEKYPILSTINLDEGSLSFAARDKRMRYSTIFSIGFNNTWTPNEFKYLLSKHFDLFNLIEEGLAIDLRKPNSEPAAQESDTTNDK